MRDYPSKINKNLGYIDTRDVPKQKLPRTLRVPMQNTQVVGCVTMAEQKYPLTHALGLHTGPSLILTEDSSAGMSEEDGAEYDALMERELQALYDRL